jgi:hypothetical protein
MLAKYIITVSIKSLSQQLLKGVSRKLKRQNHATLASLSIKMNSKIVDLSSILSILRNIRPSINIIRAGKTA